MKQVIPGLSLMLARTLLKAIELISSDHEAAKIFLKDRRITVSEKLILESYIDLRSNKYKKIIESLSKLTFSDGFVESQRLLVLGCAYNNSGDFVNAITFLDLALERSENYPQNPRMFTILYDLFIIHLNIQDMDGMKKVYSKMEDFEELSKTQDLILKDCRLQISLAMNNLRDAHLIIKKLEKALTLMTSSQIVNFYITKFDYCLSCADFTGAYKALDDLKARRSFRNSANYTFMKTLLDHYVDGTPLYLYEHDFEDQPFLLNQVRVLLSLNRGEKNKALHYWQELRKINSSVYLEDFSYKGFKCIFSLCLDKYLESRFLVSSHESGQKKMDYLLQLLREAKGPVPKETLFEILYQKPLTTKDELFRLSSLIYRLKKEKKLQIKTQKGAYLLVA